MTDGLRYGMASGLLSLLACFLIGWVVSVFVRIVFGQF